MSTQELLRRTLHAAADGIEAAPTTVSDLARRTERVQRSPRRVVGPAAIALLLSAGALGAASHLWEFDVRIYSDPSESDVGLIYNSDLFAPGAPFHCTGIFDMTPSEAEALVHDRGFQVSWQYDVPGWPLDKRPPETAYIDAVVMMDQGTARLVATPDRRSVRDDRGCP